MADAPKPAMAISVGIPTREVNDIVGLTTREATTMYDIAIGTPNTAAPQVPYSTPARKAVLIVYSTNGPSVPVAMRMATVMTMSPRNSHGRRSRASARRSHHSRTPTPA